MFTTRISPNESVKPLASRKSNAASETPLIAWRIALVIEVGREARGTRSRAAGPSTWSRGSPRRTALPRHRSRRRVARASLALVRPLLEELLRRPGPELRHLGIGLDRHVDHDLAHHGMLDLLDAEDVNVLDRVVVGVELERAARRLHLHGAHRLEERRPVLDLAVDRVDRGLGPQPGGVRGLGEPRRQPLVLARERLGERLVLWDVEPRRVMERV